MNASCAICSHLLEEGRCPIDHAYLAPMVHAATMPAPPAPLAALAVTAPRTRLVVDPLLPDVVDGYRLEYPLGLGGMGTVYLAQDERLGRPVAIKVLRAPGLGGGARLQSEARAMAAVRHPNVAEVLRAGELPDGRPFLVMEALEGRSLSERLSQGPLSIPEAIAIFRQALDGLGAIHRAGVIHRDLKPGNIFLSDDGRVRLLDFGLSLRTEPGAPPSPQTDPRSSVGTVDFAAPEQASGGSVSARSDLYALGVALFQGLTLRLPFEHPNPLEVVRRKQGQPAPRLRELIEVPPALDALVAGLLERFPVKRPESAAQVERQLAAIDLRPSRKNWVLAGIFGATGLTTIFWLVLRVGWP